MLYRLNKRYRRKFRQHRSAAMKIIMEERREKRRKATEEMKAKMLAEIESMNLQQLIKAFYEVKGQLRDLSMTDTKGSHKQGVAERKDEILLAIQEKLTKVSKQRAEKVKAKLWKDLGVII
ncbi:MAG: hypothetical protein ACE5KA_06430 [Nitrososphaerales archaeon]